MCGIAGIFNSSKGSIDQHILQTMSNTLVHRGPDNQGLWVNEDKTIGFAHQRLAIIDCAASANQPMHYLHTTITYNGEVYNYIELKEILMDKGFSFKTESDTEVILAAYIYWGVDCLNHFDGMFAFAIWDDQKKQLFIARDRFGEKPFYYTYIDNAFYFASEMKALWAIGASRDINERMLFSYLAFDHLEDPHKKGSTFFSKIHKLQRSHYAIITEKNQHHLEEICYWKIDLQKQIKINEYDAAEAFYDYFINSVKKRLRSDVPLGFSISGGLDSSCIIAAMHNITPDHKFNQTFTARFKAAEVDEGGYAKSITDYLKLPMHEVWPNEIDCLQQIEKILYHQEEPFISPSIYSQWCVYQEAKKSNITVMLDGQGADETLGGYFKYIPTLAQDLFFNDKPKYYRQMSMLSKNYDSNLNIELINYLKFYFPNFTHLIGKFRGKYFNEIKDLFDPNYFAHNKKSVKNPYPYFNSLNSNLYYDSYTYGLEKLLRIADRNSMANQIEVRLPFLNHKLVEFVFSLPPTLKIGYGYTKFILREAFKNKIPDEIAWRLDKKGFQPPTHLWLQTKTYKNLIKEIHSNKEIQQYVTPNLNSFKTIELYYFLKMSKAIH